MGKRFKARINVRVVFTFLLLTNPNGRYIVILQQLQNHFGENKYGYKICSGVTFNDFYQ